MKESDIRKTTCPHHAAAKAIMLLGVILKEPADTQPVAMDFVKEQGIDLCNGAGCAMWEPEYEKKTIELKQNEKPSGEGWHKGDRATGQPNVLWIRWVPTDSGDCGLKSKEQGCFYP